MSEEGYFDAPRYTSLDMLLGNPTIPQHELVWPPTQHKPLSCPLDPHSPIEWSLRLSWPSFSMLEGWSGAVETVVDDYHL